jgi:hypothetical protein
VRQLQVADQYKLSVVQNEKKKKLVIARYTEDKSSQIIILPFNLNHKNEQ